MDIYFRSLSKKDKEEASGAAIDVDSEEEGRLAAIMAETQLSPSSTAIPSLAESESYDLRTLLVDEERLQHITLQPQEGRFLSISDQDVALVKMSNDMKPLIIYNKDIEPEQQRQVMFIAATMAKGGKFYPKRSNRNPVINAKLKPVAASKFGEVTRNEINNINTSVTGKIDQIILQCKCHRPDVRGLAENKFDLSCVDCKTKFHRNCLKPDEGLSDPSHYTCECCKVTKEFKGVVWSEETSKRERITNTCPIDNHLTGVVLHTKLRDNNFLEKLPKDNEHDKLKQMIQKCYDNDSNGAQKIFYDHVKGKNEAILKSKDYKSKLDTFKKVQAQNETIQKKNKINEKNKKPVQDLISVPDLPTVPYPGLKNNDLYGNPFRLWNQTFHTGNTFTITQTCDKEDCKINRLGLNIEENCIPLHQIKDKNSSVVADMQKAIVGNYSMPCPSKCSGTVTYGPVQGKTLDEYEIAFDLGGAEREKVKEFKKDIFENKLPKIINVDCKNFQLSHIVLHDADRSHFTSLQFNKDSSEMFYYDGMHSDDKNDTRITVADFNQINRDKVVVNSVHYLLVEDNN